MITFRILREVFILEMLSFYGRLIQKKGDSKSCSWSLVYLSHLIHIQITSQRLVPTRTNVNRTMAQLNPVDGTDVYLWRYLPSFTAAAIFMGLFAVVTLAHCWRMTKTRTWYCSIFALGGLCTCLEIHVVNNSPLRR